jgi:hypothetical protein
VVLAILRGLSMIPENSGKSCRDYQVYIVQEKEVYCNYLMIGLGSTELSACSDGSRYFNQKIIRTNRTVCL